MDSTMVSMMVKHLLLVTFNLRLF